MSKANKYKKHSWDTNIARDWKWVTTPSRPSLSELRAMERVLEKYPRGSKILILGSTAEFRDMAYELGFRTTIVDYQPRNFETLYKHCRHPAIENSDEVYSSVAGVTKIIEEDWRDMQLEGDLYDIVIGDLAVNMVPLRHQSGLVERIASTLASGGVAVQRMWLRDPKRYGDGVTDASTIIDLHLKDEKQATHNYFHWLALPLINYFHDENLDGGGTNFQVILKELKRLHSRGAIPELLLQSFTAPWEHYKLPNVLPIKEDADRYFRIDGCELKIVYGEDWFSDLCPIYTLRKK